MGELHNELRRGPLSKAVTRALGMHVGAVGLERLDESLTVILDLFSRPEWDYLRGNDRYQAGVSSTAVAAQTGYCQLRNPVGSGKIIVVEQIILQDAGGAGNAYDIGLSTPNASGVSGSIVDSRRDRGLGVGTGAVSLGLASGRSDITGDGVAMANLPIRVRFGAGSLPPIITIPYVLAPGEALTVKDTAVNVAVGVNFIWTERTPLPGELD